MAGGITEAEFKRYMAEATGAFFLTMGGMLAGISAMFVGGGVVQVALAHGLILAMMIYFLGSISGGHFNPAVSTCMFIQKKLDQKSYLFYMIFQVIGATIGALIAVAVIPSPFWSLTAQAGATLGAFTGTPSIAGTFAPGNALILEVLMTFMLATTVSVVVAGGEKMAPLSGALIGGTLVACIMWGGPYTGASLNPARSLGPAFVSGTNSVIWASIWLYIIGPMIGGALAAISFMWFKGDLKIHFATSGPAPMMAQPATALPPPAPAPAPENTLPSPTMSPPLPAPMMTSGNQDQPKSGI